MHQAILLAFGMGVSLLSGSAYADLKVLFTFDNSGIKAHRVVEIHATGENYPTTVAELPLIPGYNMVMMKWMNADRKLLAVTQSPDPRVASSPEHVNPSSVSRVGLDEGAWVSTGPLGSSIVVVEFARNGALGLEPESWTVSLQVDN